MRESRSEFILRDPGALDALLRLDWRSRAFLTDDDMICGGVVDQPLTTAGLRHLQRLGLVRALHGVRNQGGRKRLWALDQALKIQLVLDLRAATGLKLSVCVCSLLQLGQRLEDMVGAWRDHVGTLPDLRGLQVHEAPGAILVGAPERLAQFSQASIARFVTRSRFDAAPRPSFLV